MLAINLNKNCKIKKKTMKRKKSAFETWWIGSSLETLARILSVVSDNGVHGRRTTDSRATKIITSRQKESTTFLKFWYMIIKVIACIPPCLRYISKMFSRNQTKTVRISSISHPCGIILKKKKKKKNVKLEKQKSKTKQTKHLNSHMVYTLL